MKTLLRAILAALATCPIGSSAKVFDIQHIPKNYQVLQNADNFSVECRNERTGVIDQESVDVDAATVTVEIPGSAPIVHPITHFVVGGSQTEDRFGKPALELHLEMVDWGKIGDAGVGLIWSGERFVSRHEDNVVWWCAN
jgi:hypothetical protein